MPGWARKTSCSAVARKRAMKFSSVPRTVEEQREHPEDDGLAVPKRGPSYQTAAFPRVKRALPSTITPQNN